MEQIDKAAKFVIDNTKSRILLIYGDMGSGKTTLIKAIAKILGAEDIAVSPTFSIVNEYQTTNGNSVYHFDMYRLNSLQEALDIGFEDYLDVKGSYLFIEWPQLIEGLSQDYSSIHIAVHPDQTRQITIR